MYKYLSRNTQNNNLETTNDEVKTNEKICDDMEKSMQECQ